MNRKKKINDTLKGKAKKANAKLNTRNKPQYIAKAERERLAALEKIASTSVEITMVGSETSDEPS